MGSITRHAIPNATHVHPQTLPNGHTQPRVCDFDDMVLRLVKWQPSINGLTSTYSELAASRLGQMFDAPVVRGTVVYVDRHLLPPELAARATQPFHVGFTYSPGQNFSEADYANIQNTASLPAAAVLLAWLQVGDQETRNQYLYQLQQVLPDRTTRKLNHFILVDLACICGQHDWSNSPLDKPDTHYTLPPHLRDRVKMACLDPVIERVNAIPETEIRECFKFYPGSWNIDNNLVDKVVNYVIKRRQHLCDILRASLPSGSQP